MTSTEETSPQTNPAQHRFFQGAPEPGQDPTVEGGNRAGAALVISTNPSTPGGARRQQEQGNKDRPGEPAASRRANSGQESPGTTFTSLFQPPALPQG